MLLDFKTLGVWVNCCHQRVNCIYRHA